jgi:hypothetical protein
MILFVHPNLLSVNISPIEGCFVTGLKCSALNLCPKPWFTGEHLNIRKLVSHCAVSCFGEEGPCKPEVSAVSSVADN